MLESLLSQPAADQAEIIRAISAQAGRSAVVLEKDLWVCWVLRALFEMPGRKRMVFKGGTSLSKVFAAIDRFSEDIDLTIDYRELDPDANPFADGLSNSQRDRVREHLGKYLAEYLQSVVAPYLRETLARQYGGEAPTVAVGEDGEKLTVSIRSQLAGARAYVRDGVLLEFGGRNVIEPHQQHTIQPYLSGHLDTLELPSATIDVLAPERTFWEKATLVHAECNGRNTAIKGVGRLSRHWYDLSRLANHDIGAKALANRYLLVDVVNTKKVIYRSAKAQYDDCTSGRMRLIPGGELLDALHEDYRAMIVAGMFEGLAPPFDEIVTQLKELEQAINVVTN